MDDRQRAQSFIDANILLHQPGGPLVRANIVKNLAAEFAAVRAAAIEECAKVAESCNDCHGGIFSGGCAAAIRAMNKEPKP